MPKVYIPKVDDNIDEIERRNRESVNIYRNQMAEKRKWYGDEKYYGEDQTKYETLATPVEHS